MRVVTEAVNSTLALFIAEPKWGSQETALLWFSSYTSSVFGHFASVQKWRLINAFLMSTLSWGYSKTMQQKTNWEFPRVAVKFLTQGIALSATPGHPLHRCFPLHPQPFVGLCNLINKWKKCYTTTLLKRQLPRVFNLDVLKGNITSKELHMLYIL